MARWLLLEFDDDAQCEAMMAKIQEQTAAGKAYRLKGLFAKPTKFCECPPEPRRQQPDLVRGERYGWVVHRLCRKAWPMPVWPKNLLESTPISPAFRGDVGVWMTPMLGINRLMRKGLEDV